MQDNGATDVRVFAPICTAPVFDTGGCTTVVSATTDYSTTANLQNSYTAK